LEATESLWEKEKVEITKHLRYHHHDGVNSDIIIMMVSTIGAWRRRREKMIQDRRSVWRAKND
jgi:hypothetical protein